MLWPFSTLDVRKAAEKDFVTKTLKIRSNQVRLKVERQKRFRETIFPLPVKVTRIDIDGVDRTSPEMLKQIVMPLVSCQTYGDLVLATKGVHNRLKTLGCFKNVDICLDKEHDLDNGEERIRVAITVIEMRRIVLDARAITSNLNYALCNLSASLTNVFRHGESLRAETSLQIDGRIQSFSFHFIKEIIHSLFGYVTWVSSLSSSNVDMNFRQLSLNRYSAACALIIQPLSWLENKFCLSSLIETLYPTSQSGVQFNPRTECGYGLKSSLSHTLTVDTRDDTVLPNRGFFVKWTNALSSSHMGNAGFASTDLLTSLHMPIAAAKSISSLSISLRAAKIGMTFPFRDSILSCTSSDHAWFLNPLQCRGWNGDTCKNLKVLNKTGLLLGASGKLNFPIPFFRGNSNSWILGNTRTHLFCDFGQVLFQDSTPTSSLTVGLGMAIRIGKYGRAELNFCQSLYNFDNHDLIFGIGIDFL